MKSIFTSQVSSDNFSTFKFLFFFFPFCPSQDSIQSGYLSAGKGDC